MNEMNYLNIMIGSTTGGVLVTGTSKTAINAEAIVCNEDTVIAELEVNGVDVVADRGFAGETIAIGMFIGTGFSYLPNKAKRKFTSITLTSGSVMVY